MKKENVEMVPAVALAIACSWGLARAQSAPVVPLPAQANHQQVCFTPSGAADNAQNNGSWVFHQAGTGSASHFVTSQPSFPKSIVDGAGSSARRWTPSALVAQKMQMLLQGFKDLCPRPSYLSHTYGINALNPKQHTPMSYQLHIGDAFFFYDNSGKVSPMKPGLQLGNMYEGLANVYVNYSFESPSQTGPGRKGFTEGVSISEKLTYKDTRLNLRSTEPVYVIAPQNNFADEAKNWQENLQNVPALRNLPAAHFRLQHLTIQHNPKMRGGSVEKTAYDIKNIVFLSHDNQLPFTPLTRGELFELLETLTLPPDEKNAVQAMRSHFQGSLQDGAILAPDHASLHTGALWYYTANAPANQRKPISAIFSTDSHVGHSLVRWKKGYYDGLKDGEIRSLIIEWNETYRPAHNKDHAQVNTDSKPTFNSDAPGNMRYAMRHNFDWSKLMALLLPP